MPYIIRNGIQYACGLDQTTYNKIGSGTPDPGFTADNLIDACNEIKQSLSDLKHVPITTSTATFPSTVSIQGDNYYQKNGRLVTVIVNLKIVSSTKGWHRVTNYIPNIVDRPIYNITGNASDGDVDGIMQPFNITSQGVLEIYNTKTGTTYCQGSVSYFANDLG